MYTELIIAVAVIVVLYLFSNKKDSRLPPSYGPIPFFGCFHKFGLSPVGCIRWAADKFGDCFTLKILGFDMTFMLSPDAQAAFFRATDEELSAKEPYKFMIPVFGPGVVYDSPTEVMYEQLRFVRSSLALSQLKKSVATIEGEANEYFTRKWGNSGEVDLLEEMNKLTILTASRCLMGEAIRRHLGEDNEKIAHLYHDLERGINPLSFFFPYLPLPGLKRRDRAREEIAEIFRSIIAERRKNKDDNKDDIMGILMSCEYKDGTNLADEQLAGMMIALLFAGQHTSSITATWTGLLLNDQRKFFDEVVEEQRKIRSTIAPGQGLSFDNVKSMPKLENAVRETLRMYPPLIILMRKVLTDMHYTSPVTKKEYVIPAGHTMCVSPGASMRLPTTFENPDTYDPHRFERGEHLKHPYNIISFGGGKHGCPGENFGIIQIKTLWSVLLNTYEIEFPAVPPPDYTSMVAGPKGPIMVKYRKRTTPL